MLAYNTLVTFINNGVNYCYTQNLFNKTISNKTRNFQTLTKLANDFVYLESNAIPSAIVV